jgi:hypothetical protein
MKPFSTPVLAKRTYRELKLLKHLRHENVSANPSILRPRAACCWTRPSVACLQRFARPRLDFEQ